MPVSEARESHLRVRGVDVHQKKLLGFEGDDAPFAVMLLYSHAIADVERFTAREDRRSGVTLPLGIVPERLVARKFKVENAGT